MSGVPPAKRFSPRDTRRKIPARFMGENMKNIQSNYSLATNTRLLRLANDMDDEAAYAELQERAAKAGCLIRDLPRSRFENNED